jgi:cytochrome c biogenesis protein CcmG, thiol:disulfide interchange protein DsbE
VRAGRNLWFGPAMRRALSPVAIAVICVLVALLALLAYGIAQNSPDRSVEQSLRSGERKQAPDVDLPKLGGDDTSSLADYRGQVVVLNFWASWCKPCKDESPLLERWQGRMRGRGTVLGIDGHDVTSDAQAFIRKYGLSYPMLHDHDGDVAADYGVLGFPETFVIDRQGRIVAVQRGPVDSQFMRANVEPLL